MSTQIHRETKVYRLNYYEESKVYVIKCMK